MQGEASTRLGFTDYFLVELAWAKLLGAVLSLAPVPARNGSGHALREVELTEASSSKE